MLTLSSWSCDSMFDKAPPEMRQSGPEPQGISMSSRCLQKRSSVCKGLEEGHGRPWKESGNSRLRVATTLHGTERSEQRRRPMLLKRSRAALDTTSWKLCMLSWSTRYICSLAGTAAMVAPLCRNCCNREVYYRWTRLFWHCPIILALLVSGAIRDILSKRRSICTRHSRIGYPPCL